MRKPEPVYKTEADLCAAFIAWVKSKGWTAYAETAGWDILLAHAEGWQIGVQAKLRFNLEVIAQTITHWYAMDDEGPDFRVILVPWRDGRAELIGGARAPGVTPKSAGLDRSSGVRSNATFHENHSGLVERRNKRSVWEIGSEPYKGAHTATFPQALVGPCVLAGSRAGDIVFDPFMGSGTVAQVAARLGRRYLGCELNPKDEPLQRERITQHGLELA